MKILGKLVDLFTREIYPAEITITGGKISDISRTRKTVTNYILPGFIDSHVHIESSMVTPGAFASVAVRHGTIGTVSDPHEIANVLGVPGVEFMIKDGKSVPFYFWFGAPSCVPATLFESSGASIGVREIEELLSRKEIKYLSEMMNFPGVINNDEAVTEKLKIARKFGKEVDGHAPGLKGNQLKEYVSAGITTDHECSTMEEAVEKINLGMKILIREGSAARNLSALKPILKDFPASVMLCSDDIHPEMLMKGHINRLAAALIREGFDTYDVLRSCSHNPVMHYGLEAGLLREGDYADFIVTEDLNKMEISETWIKGRKVFDGKNVLFSYTNADPVNKFNCTEISEKDLLVKRESKAIRVMQAYDGELLTGSVTCPAGDGAIVRTDISEDLLKIVVKDRYSDRPPSVGFIKGFGLKQGAFASSVAHDSHNIICVGVDDRDIADCINTVIAMKGGLAISSAGRKSFLQLRIGGIMSDSPCSEVAVKYEDLSEKVKLMGCRLTAPFMTLSFMALLVIPELKMSDRGLFDVNKFNFTSLFIK